jgi:hypothetical protein
MKHAVAIGLWLFVGFAFGQDGITKKDFKRLQVLAGVWQLDTDAAVFEAWKLTPGGQLSGKGFRLSASDTLVSEKLELIWRSGAVVYIPTVPNQNGGQPVEFTLTGVKGERFIFENPEHDFPQRIIYHFLSKNDLEVVLDAPYAEPPAAVQQLTFKRK